MNTGDSQELHELMRLLRDRVDPSVDLQGGDAFATFIDELHHIDEHDVPLGRQDRWQDALIQQEIEAGSRVLDIGCGDGELLAALRDHRKAKIQGVELDQDQVAACIARGVPVFQADVDEGLKQFPDASYDYVVLEETLQTLHEPHTVLTEMLRIGRCGIVSFPNFGHWRIRLYLAARGRMPVSRRLPHQWYDTPNIHLLTLRDFRNWCHEHNARIDRAFVRANGEVRPLQDGDNLDAAEVLLFLHRD